MEKRLQEIKSMREHVSSKILITHTYIYMYIDKIRISLQTIFCKIE